LPVPVFPKEVTSIDAKAWQESKRSFDGVVLPWLPEFVSPRCQQLERLNSMPRRLTGNWPGTGRGAVQLVFAPKVYGENMIVLAGGDPAGLSKAVAALAKLRGTKAVAALPKLRGTKAMAALAKLRGTKAVAALPKLRGTRNPPAAAGAGMADARKTVQSSSRRPLPDRAAKFGPMLNEAAVSLNGRYVAFGSLSWGNNLFLLTKDGKLLSAIRAGKSFPSPMEPINVLIPHLAVQDSGDLYARIADIAEPHVSLGRYRDGKLVERFAMMGLRNAGPGDGAIANKKRDWAFAVAPDGTVLSAGEYGFAAFARNGRELWRQDLTRQYDTADSLIAKAEVSAVLSPDGVFAATAIFPGPWSRYGGPSTVWLRGTNTGKGRGSRCTGPGPGSRTGTARDFAREPHGSTRSPLGRKNTLVGLHYGSPISTDTCSDAVRRQNAARLGTI